MWILNWWKNFTPTATKNNRTIQSYIFSLTRNIRTTKETATAEQETLQQKGIEGEVEKMFAYFF